MPQKRVSRVELRKQQRLAKKAKREQHWAKRHPNHKLFHGSAPKVFDSEKPPVLETLDQNETEEIELSGQETEIEEEEELGGSVLDAEIAYLSKKLKIEGEHGMNKLSKELKKDGLEELFGIWDNLGASSDQDQDEEQPEEIFDGSLSLAQGEQIPEDSQASGSEDESEHEEQEQEESEERPDFAALAEKRRELQKNLYRPEQDQGDKYIPPSLRKRILEEEAKSDSNLVSLRKSLNGLLNRIGESNMHKICVSILELQEEAGIGSLTDCLVEIVFGDLQARISHAIIAFRCAVASFLHRQVGVQIAAKFVEKWFEEFFQKPRDSQNTTHLVTLLAFLYEFALVASPLVFDTLTCLIQDFAKSESLEAVESEAHQVLVLLKLIGEHLRKEDPVRFKEFIQGIQSAFKSLSLEPSARILYVFDVIDSLKNNKTRDKTEEEAMIQRISRWLDSQSSPGFSGGLRVTREDLENKETRGRWWLVGSSWRNPEDKSESQRFKIDDSDPLMHLAKEQRLTTDLRKRLFCLIMGASDYLDCFEKVIKVGLQKHENRELIHVIVHCCGQERTYNPYYHLLLEKLCKYDRSHRFTLHLLFWDIFKQTQDFDSRKACNLAKLLAGCIAHFTFSLSLLKVVDFNSLMNSKTILFFHTFLKTLLLEYSVSMISDAFERICFKSVSSFVAFSVSERSRN
jgi:nucleolar MIF4G domain-containing protein 1